MFARPTLVGALGVAATSGLLFSAAASAQHSPQNNVLAAQASARDQQLAPKSGSAVPAAKRARKLRVRISERRLSVRSGSTALLSGRVSPKISSVNVSLQVRRRSGWKPIDRDKTNSKGRFYLSEKVKEIGSADLRVRVAGTGRVIETKKEVGKLSVYRPAHASWYGPGLYGNRLGCGGRLGGATLGVAHKTLPCGTRVAIKRGDRELTVRVIDRGPYIAGREFDLTAATARRLGFSGVGQILVAH